MTTEDRQTTETAPPAARLRGAEPGHVLSEFERLLTESGCPNCRHVAEIERSFFSWFQIESHTSAEVQAKLRAAMGMCPAHARRLLEGVGEGHVMTIVMREALAGARIALRPDAQIGPCPACEAAAFGTHARTLLIDGLSDPAPARAYIRARRDMPCPFPRRAAKHRFADGQGARGAAVGEPL